MATTRPAGATLAAAIAAIRAATAVLVASGTQAL
jgi:hypothetical protein